MNLHETCTQKELISFISNLGFIVYFKNSRGCSTGYPVEGLTIEFLEKEGITLGVTPFEIGMVPISGPVQQKQCGDLVVSYRDAVRFWSDGSADVCHSYYRIVHEQLRGEGDYCFYCGAFLGENGEYRYNNFDCPYCGAN